MVLKIMIYEDLSCEDSQLKSLEFEKQFYLPTIYLLHA